ACDPDPVRLRVLVVDPGVADMRGGHPDHLTVVRRVGQSLLIAGHPGGEDRLSERLAPGTVGLTREGAAVLEDEDRGLGRRPATRRWAATRHWGGRGTVGMHARRLGHAYLLLRLTGRLVK